MELPHPQCLIVGLSHASWTGSRREKENSNGRPEWWAATRILQEVMRGKLEDETDSEDEAAYRN